jgi:hypothetical protein
LGLLEAPQSLNKGHIKMTDSATVENLNTPPNPFNTRSLRMQSYAAHYIDRALQPVVWFLSKFTKLKGVAVLCWPDFRPRTDAWREVDSYTSGYYLKWGYIELVADVIHSEPAVGAARGDSKTLDGWW